MAKTASRCVAARRRGCGLLRQFTAPLVLVLIAAAAVTGFLGEWVDASVIFIVVVVNAIVGFFQESKAENALEALMKMVVAEAVVRRDGKKIRVNSTRTCAGRHRDAHRR
jgi:cation-transporting P-type ATPase F